MSYPGILEDVHKLMGQGHRHSLIMQVIHRFPGINDYETLVACVQGDANNRNLEALRTAQTETRAAEAKVNQLKDRIAYIAAQTEMSTLQQPLWTLLKGWWRARRSA